MLIGIDRLGKPRKQGPHLPLSIPVQGGLPGGAARGSCQGELIGIARGESRSADAGYADSRRKFAKCPVASGGTTGGCTD